MKKKKYGVPTEMCWPNIDRNSWAAVNHDRLTYFIAPFKILIGNIAADYDTPKMGVAGPGRFVGPSKAIA